jgi:hypothetical protein
LLQGKLETHDEYARLTKLVEANPNGGQSLTRAFVEERGRLVERQSKEADFFRSNTAINIVKGILNLFILQKLYFS